VITANPADIANDLTYRQRNTLHKIGRFAWRQTTFAKSRGRGFARYHTTDGVTFTKELLSNALLTPLWNRDLLVTERGILRVSVLGQLVINELLSKKRKTTPKPVVFQQDETGQYNMDV
jgi:hypothetical protein